MNFDSESGPFQKLLQFKPIEREEETPPVHMRQRHQFFHCSKAILLPSKLDGP